MHYSNLFNKVYYNNQQVFNKKLNWYFDIKNILFRKESQKKIINNTNQLVKEYSSLKQLRIKKRKSFFKQKKLDKKKFLNNKDFLFKKKVLDSIEYLNKKKVEKFFDYLIIQGSLATNDYIKNWSDFDCVGIIKNEVLLDPNKLLKLRKILNSFYKKIIKFSKFQHHGIILFSHYDLKNYMPGYLPIEALKGKSLSILDNKIFTVNKIVIKKHNLSKNILLNRKFYINKSFKDKFYDHHVFDNTKLSVPLKKKEKTLKQLFVHIGFMLNIPILYLDAIGKSSHKKIAFKKFYKIIGNSDIVNFIKRHEYLRKNWSNYYENNKIINNKLFDYLGKDYFKDCLKCINFCLKKLT